MLDIQIISNPHISDAWFEQCLTSVLEAEKQSPFPISISIHDPVPGHVGRARQRAFSEADQPYVAFVDPDDWITSNTLTVIAQHLADGVHAVRTRGALVMPDGRIQKHAVGFFACQAILADQVDWENRNTGCKPDKICGTCELQRISRPVIVPEVCYYRRYGYGSWASKLTGQS